jgi:hypothetical protein
MAQTLPKENSNDFAKTRTSGWICAQWHTHKATAKLKEQMLWYFPVSNQDSLMQWKNRRDVGSMSYRQCCGV